MKVSFLHICQEHLRVDVSPWMRPNGKHVMSCQHVAASICCTSAVRRFASPMFESDEEVILSEADVEELDELDLR